MNVLLVVVGIEIAALMAMGLVYILIDQRRRLTVMRALMERWDIRSRQIESIAEDQSESLAKQLGLKSETRAELQNHLLSEQIGFLSDTFRRMQKQTPDAFAGFAKAHALEMARHDQALIDALRHDHLISVPEVKIITVADVPVANLPEIVPTDVASK